VKRRSSLSSAPEDSGQLRLTIKLASNGAISQWLRSEARVGSVVSLSQAMGSFVLPDPIPPRQRSAEIGGRALLVGGILPPLWLAGVSLLGLSKILEISRGVRRTWRSRCTPWH